MRPPKDHASARAPRVALLDIARTFLAIGSASFSLAALGESKDQVTRKRRWFTDEEFMQGLGLAQLMPGAPTVNLSSYLGYRLRGLPGAAAATVAFLLPCFVLMLLLSYLSLRHGRLPVVASLLHGLGALVLGLVLSTAIDLWRSGVRSPFDWLMALTGFALVFRFDLGVARVLLVAGGASLLAFLAARRFPSLGRWVAPRGEGSARNPPGSPGDPEPRSEAGLPASACSAAPSRLGRRHTAAVVAWLALALALDLVLIRLRPELMDMGTRFLRIGALVFGSGYAMLPFIQEAFVSQTGWLTNEQFAAALALSLVTPGPVTIIAVFIGYKVAGVAGALVGAVNIYLPACALTMVAAAPYARAGEVRVVRQLARGIVAAFIGTLIVVVVKLASGTPASGPALALAAGAFVAQRLGRVGTLWIVAAGALVSLVAFPG